MRKLYFTLLVLLVITICFPTVSAQTRPPLNLPSPGEIPNGYETPWVDKEACVPTFQTLITQYGSSEDGWESIGKSSSSSFGGDPDWDIVMFKIGNSSGGRVMIDAQMHGNEFYGFQALYAVIRWVLNSSDADAVRIRQRNYLLIVPVVDYRFARTNFRVQSSGVVDPSKDGGRVGVNLNRNFLPNWNLEGSGTDGYSGPSAGSEAETQALINAFNTWHPRVYWNLHQGSGPSTMVTARTNFPQAVTDANAIDTILPTIQSQLGVTSPWGFSVGSSYSGGFSKDEAASRGSVGILTEIWGNEWSNNPTTKTNLETGNTFKQVKAMVIAMCRAVEGGGGDNPPTCSISSIAESSSYAYSSGSSIWYNTASTGSFTVNAAATDDNGVSKVNFPTTVSAGGDDTTSPYSFTYDWDTSDTSSSTATVTAYDSASQTGTCTFNLNRDVTVPTTSASIAGSYTITLSCSDSASGCNRTYYCIDTSNACNPTTQYSSPVSYSCSGICYARYYSTDRVRNQENVKSNQFGSTVIQNKIYGQLKDMIGNSLSATIIAYLPGTNTIVASNTTYSQGNYNLYLPEDIYDIQFNFTSFYIKKLSVNLTSDITDLIKNITSEEGRLIFHSDFIGAEIFHVYNNKIPTNAKKDGSYLTMVSLPSQLTNNTWFFNSTENKVYMKVSPVQQTCSDGTPYGQCSNVNINKPSWCDNSGNLIPNQCGSSRHNCPCPTEQVCNTTSGSCYTPMSTYTLLTGINYMSSGNRWDDSDTQLNADFGRFSGDGIKHISVRLMWSVLEPDHSDTSTALSSTYLNNVKRVLTAANNSGVKVNIDFWTQHGSTLGLPTWINPSGSETYWDIEGDTHIRNHYIRYMQAVVNQLKGYQSLESWTVLNEPWWGTASNGVYVDKPEYQAAFPILRDAIKSVDPNHIVTCRFTLSYTPGSGRFDQSVYDVFDIFALTEYLDPSNASDTKYNGRWSYWDNTIGNLTARGKHLWVIEFGDNTTKETPEHVRLHYEQSLQKFNSTGIVDRAYAWAWQTRNAGLEDYNIYDGTNPKPAYYELVT